MSARVGLPGSGGTGDVVGGVWHAADVNKLPGGRVMHLTSSTQLNITSPTTVFTSTTFTANASRIYVVSCDLRVQSTVANDSFLVGIYDSAGGLIRQGYLPIGDANIDYILSMTYEDDNPSAGSTFYTIQASALHGTGTFNNSGVFSYMRIDDVGPHF